MPRLMTIHHTGILSIVQGTDVATDALFCSRKYCHVWLPEGNWDYYRDLKSEIISTDPVEIYRAMIFPFGGVRIIAGNTIY